jgi:ferritin
MSEKVDPHMTHNYSHEQLIKFSYIQELARLRSRYKDDHRFEILENFMQQRVKEITERWK